MGEEEKETSWFKLILIFLLVCAGIFLIYNLPVFWARPKTAEYLPAEGEGTYLGISSGQLKKLKKNISSYPGTGFLTGECYYQRNMGGEYFDGVHYTANFYGMITDIDFSRQFKEQELVNNKYEYLKYFISKYGPGYQKALRVYTPYKDARYTYEQLIWEKKEIRVVLEFSFYDNSSKNGYISKNRGIFLHLGYPKATGENFFNKIVKDPRDPELLERFKLNFPDLENN